MNFEEFNRLVEKKRKEKPIWFAGDVEPVVSEKELKLAESQLNTVLPDEFRLFLMKYGGGYFGLTNIFTATDNEEWGLVKRNSELESKEGFLVVSDDEAGGYYGFLRQGTKCSDSVYYFYPGSGEVIQIKYSSFLSISQRLAFKNKAIRRALCPTYRSKQIGWFHR